MKEGAPRPNNPAETTEGAEATKPFNLDTYEHLANVEFGKLLNKDTTTSRWERANELGQEFEELKREYRAAEATGSMEIEDFDRLRQSLLAAHKNFIAAAQNVPEGIKAPSGFDDLQGPSPEERRSDSEIGEEIESVAAPEPEVSPAQNPKKSRARKTPKAAPQAVPGVPKESVFMDDELPQNDSLMESSKALRGISAGSKPESRKELLSNLKDKIGELQKRTAKSTFETRRRSPLVLEGENPPPPEQIAKPKMEGEVQEGNVWGTEDNYSAEPAPETAYMPHLLRHEKEQRKVTAIFQDNTAEEQAPAPVLAPEPIKPESEEGMGPNNPILMRQAGGRQPRKSEVSKAKIDESLSAAEKKLARLVLTTRGPEALAQLQKSLKEGGKSTDKIHAAGLVHAEKMYESERAYFSELKNFQRERGFGSVFLDKFFKREVKQPEKLPELKDQWLKSRTDYAGFMRSGAEASHIERHKRKTGKTSELLTGAVMDRYQRRFMLKEVVLGAEEAEQRARIEGLDSRDKKGIEKLFDRFDKLPKPAKVLIGSALLGLGSGIAVAGGSAIASIGLVMAVPSAIAGGIGMAQKNENARDFWGGVGGGFGLFTVGGLLGLTGRTGASAGHTLAGTKEKATRKLNQREGVGNLADPKNLKRFARERKEALRAEEKIEIDRRRFGMGAAVLGGAVVGGAINHEIGPLHLPTLGHGVTDHMSIGEHVGRVNINDADRLLGHFATKLHHNDFAGGHEPASVQKLYELLQTKDHPGFLHGENNASIKLGLEGPDGSAVMQPGDTISLDHGEIALDRVGHPEMHHVLIDRGGHLHPVDQDTWRQALVVHQETPKAETPAQNQPPAQPEATQAAVSADATPPRDLNAAAPEPDYAKIYPDLNQAAATPAPSGPEAVHTPVAEVPQAIHAYAVPVPVDTLTHTPGWETARDAYSIDLLNIPGDDPTSTLMRENFLALVRESGVQPVDNQSLEQYVQIATKAIQDRTH